jgi:hypothetical protein
MQIGIIIIILCAYIICVPKLSLELLTCPSAQASLSESHCKITKKEPKSDARLSEFEWHHYLLAIHRADQILTCECQMRIWF